MTEIFNGGGIIAVTNDGPKGPARIAKSGSIGLAIKNNVTGWIKNLDDGRVEIMIEGEDKCVDSVIGWCNFGPANSRVDDIQTNHENYVGKYKNFEVRY